MRIRSLPLTLAAVVAVGVPAWHLTAAAQAPALTFSATRELAPGVTYRELDDPDYFGEGGPISARFIEVRPGAATLDVAMGGDGTQGRAPVVHMAERRKALAAINAGYFLPTGDPAGIYKINGLLVSDTARQRAAVAFGSPDGPPLLFDRVTVSARLRVNGVDVPVSGIDTAHGDNTVILFTPRFGDGVRGEGRLSEWALADDPLHVVATASREADSDAAPLQVPDGGYVLSAAGTPPAALANLHEGAEVSIEFDYDTEVGADAEAWARADDIIGGVGLLLRDGKPFTDWTIERITVSDFATSRHPRTFIGRDREGDTWLVTIDGRQPAHSVGMTLLELIDFAQRLGLTDAVNLDGGGSTTMVVEGALVNRPSDAVGLRAVSDGIVVLVK